MLSKNRDEAPAKAFFDKAIRTNGLPEKVTMDKSGVNKAGINVINFQFIIFYLLGLTLLQITVRQIKYLSNIVEQDHRGIKRITNPMMGFETFYSAKATLAGIELNRMLKKKTAHKCNTSSIFVQFYTLVDTLRLGEIRL